MDGAGSSDTTQVVPGVRRQEEKEFKENEKEQAEEGSQERGGPENVRDHVCRMLPRSAKTQAEN